MAFTINGSPVDETTGTQNEADLADSTGNDVADGLSTLVRMFQKSMRFFRSWWRPAPCRPTCR